jgi:hypothetical protein
MDPVFILPFFALIFVYFGAPWQGKYSINTSAGFGFSRNQFVGFMLKGDVSQLEYIAIRVLAQAGESSKLESNFIKLFYFSNANF